ncbi:hypothetical protein BDL97_09G100500 [Sphagnum fallax]|nr:hypothetical protein BDL97_09G100500 [Sphagnum fallax]
MFHSFNIFYYVQTYTKLSPNDFIHKPNKEMNFPLIFFILL